MGIIPDRYIRELTSSVRQKWPMSGKASGFLAVSPVIVFLAIYLLSSIVAGDFYRIPISAAFLIASIYSMVYLPSYGDKSHGT